MGAYAHCNIERHIDQSFFEIFSPRRMKRLQATPNSTELFRMFHRFPHTDTDILYHNMDILS